MRGRLVPQSIFVSILHLASDSLRYTLVPMGPTLLVYASMFTDPTYFSPTLSVFTSVSYNLGHL